MMNPKHRKKETVRRSLTYNLVMIKLLKKRPSPEKKSIYKLTQRCKYKTKKQQEKDEKNKLDKQSDSEITCSERELKHFLYGCPISFFNLIPGIPIEMSHTVRKSLYYSDIGGLQSLQAYQALHRIIFGILASKGFKYSELPKLLGSSQHLESASAWKSWFKAFLEIYNEWAEFDFPPYEPGHPTAQEMGSPIYFDRIVENHQKFLRNQF